jgi:hypothetical protein
MTPQAVAAGLIALSLVVAGGLVYTLDGGKRAAKPHSGQSGPGLLTPTTPPPGGLLAPDLSLDAAGIPLCPASTRTAPTELAIKVSGQPAAFDRHCYYLRANTPARVTLTDAALNTDTGLPIPEAFNISTTSAPAFGGSKAIGWVYANAPNVGVSPTALDDTPISFSVPALAKGTYYLGLFTDGQALPAILTVA